MSQAAGSGNAVSIACEWWRDLNPKDASPSGYRRTALARLRRAARPIEVMQEPEALRLIARLPRNPERVAILAGVLAFVRETDDRPVARAVGRAGLNDDRPPALLAVGRFRRLLQEPADGLLAPMRRLVRMTKGKVNVRDLSGSILYWGDGVRKRWIFEYYAVGAAVDGPAAGAPPGGRSERRELDDV